MTACVQGRPAASRPVRARMVLAAVLLLAPAAHARTSDGNGFALYLSEAATDAERKELVDDAKGRPHYFRYLRITSLEEGDKDGRAYMAVEAVEPSSLMRVKFRVTKPASLQLLRNEPAPGPGDAIAVTGNVTGADHKANVITLHPVIVRHKDRLEPKVGQELLAEVAPDSVYYSFTGGREIVTVSYRDRDLLERKNAIIGTQGKQGWADFLAREVAARKQARAGGGK